MKILATARLLLRELTLNDKTDLMKELCDQESMFSGDCGITIQKIDGAFT